MEKVTRRNFIKIGLATSLLSGCGDEITELVQTHPDFSLGHPGGSLSGNLLSDNAGDYTSAAGGTRKAIPSACWQCATRNAGH